MIPTTFDLRLGIFLTAMIVCATFLHPGSSATAAGTATAGAPATSSSGPSAAETVTVSTAGDHGHASVTLQNTTEKAQTIHIQNTFWHDRSNATPAADWTNLKSGLGPTADRTFVLEPKSTATFEVSGVFSKPGVYQTQMQVDGGETPPRRIAISIARTASELAPMFLGEPRTVRFQLGPFEGWPNIGNTNDRKVRVIGRNATSDPVEIGQPVAGPIYRADESGDTSIGSVGALAVVPGECPSPIPPSASCAFDVTLPASLGAGRYGVDLTVNGAQSGQSTKTMKVEIRSSPFWAGGLVVGGAFVGLLVASWREQGRQLVDQLIASAEMRTLLVRLSKGASKGIALAAKSLMAETRTAEREAARGIDRKSKIEEIRVRATALANSQAAYAIVASWDEAHRRMLAKLTDRIDAVASRPNWTASDLDRATNRLRAESEALNDLFDAMRKARGLLADVAPLNAWIAGKARDAQTELKNQINAAAEPISTKGSAELPEAAAREKDLQQRCTVFTADQIAAALAALEAAVVAAASVKPPPANASDLAALLGDIRAAKQNPSMATATRLAERAQEIPVPTPPVTESAGPSALAADRPILPNLPVGGLAVETDVSLFGLTGTESVSELEGKRRTWDRLTNGIVLLVIGAVGVVTIWMPNPVWGTTLDWIVAFLAGIGTRLAIGNLPVAGR